METLHQLTVGLDLGDTSSEVCVLDSSAEVVLRTSLSTSQEEFRRFFGEYLGATVVFEVGSQSRWVQSLLRAIGIDVITADPRQIPLITKSLRKNDKRDAYLLARMGQAMPDMITHVEHRPQDLHRDLQVIRTRKLLVSQRTQTVNHIRGVVKAASGQRITSTATYFFSKAPEQVPKDLEETCKPLFTILETLHQQIRKLEKRIDELIATRYPAAAKLMQIPSVGPITALTFVLTIGDQKRIRGTRNVAPYLGLTPRQKESGDSSPQLGITKAGDTDLRRLLVICAHHLLARGKDCQLKRWGLKLCERGGKNAKKRAAVAVARKLSVQMLAIWRSNEDYDYWHTTPKESGENVERRKRRTPSSEGAPPQTPQFSALAEVPHTEV